MRKTTWGEEAYFDPLGYLIAEPHYGSVRETFKWFKPSTLDCHTIYTFEFIFSSLVELLIALSTTCIVAHQIITNKNSIDFHWSITGWFVYLWLIRDGSWFVQSEIQIIAKRRRKQWLWVVCIHYSCHHHRSHVPIIWDFVIPSRVFMIYK